jgi:hypothetical protein
MEGFEQFMVVALRKGNGIEFSTTMGRGLSIAFLDQINRERKNPTDKSQGSLYVFNIPFAPTFRPETNDIKHLF